MIRFLHHLFSPHCPDCLKEELIRRNQDEKVNECKSCVTLEIVNAQLREENQRLLNIVLNKHEQNGLVPQQEELKPIQTIPTLWRTRRARYEAEDRIKADEARASAQVLKEKVDELKNAKTTEELEKSLDVVIPQVQESSNG